MRSPKAQRAAPLPALTTVRGFHTPAASDCEDSDYSVTSTPRHVRGAQIDDVVSANSSPMLRSVSNTSMGGISKLKLQLDTLTLDQPDYRRNAFSRNQSQNRLHSLARSSGSSEGESVCTSYEVPLEHDFVSSDVPDGSKPLLNTIEGGLVSNVARKMTADDFEPLRCLGKGTYGTVLLVKQESTGRLYAQKQFRKASLTVHKKLVEQTKTERSILESVNRHPFVVKLFYAFQDHEKLYLILEYAQGGELFTHLAQERMFDEPTASFYLAEMVLALEHLHTNLGVVYRDLKPENCLLDAEGHLLLTDFGLSKVAVDSSSTDACKSILGTIEYMAPEVIEGKKYGFAVDWWSLGALAFDFLTGAPPFQANNHAKILDKIVKSKLSMPYFLGPDAKDLLTRLLRKDPSKRLGGTMPKDMAIIKKHRFFRKIDWVKLERREVQPPIVPLVTDPELAENFSSEFTDLGLSPAEDRKAFAERWAESGEMSGVGSASNPFGGFSYVASTSLLEGNGFA